MTTDVGDLSTRDIGKLVTITTPEATVTGRLREIRTETDWITSTPIGKEPGIEDELPSRSTTAISVGRWHTDNMPMDAPVIFLEER